MSAGDLQPLDTCRSCCLPYAPGMQIVGVGNEPVGLIAIGSDATGIFAFGQLAAGVVAIGQVATGVVAIGQVATGQLATGVVAVGQLARGGIVGGQLALGLVSFGQISVGVCWSAGLLGIGGTSGPGLILGLFGRLSPPQLFGRAGGVQRGRVAGRGVFDAADLEDEPGRAAELAEISGNGALVNAPALKPWRVAVKIAVTVAIATVWWMWAGAPLVDALIGSKGILIVS